jgi:hypothetical protein
MRKRLLLCALAMFLSAISSFAQQTPMQPLTFWYEYTVNPGKEDQFLGLVKTVGAPVRDKLMADGVVLAWGVQVPLLRQPGSPTHSIWYAVADWAGVQKVSDAMTAQFAKLNEEASKGGVTKKGASPTPSLTTRLAETTDLSKTRDFLTRDLVIVLGPQVQGEVLPYTRFNFFKVRPGKGAEFRKTWEKYNKPVFDKLVADGTILAFGLAIEEVRTEGSFTHFVWYDTKDLSGMDKVRAAFNSDRDRRSQEEQDGITSLFLSLVDADASRSEVDHAVIFHASAPK